MMVRSFLTVLSVVCLITIARIAWTEIPKPDDAPQPLSPAESIKRVTLPEGFHLQLIASEPLIHEASGVCWDERGRMFIGELHGYNLEGQFDIEELNKAGVLDTKARRVHATQESKKKAEAGTFGTVKLLVDINGDGVMDKAEIWADNLPPVYGLCAARGGIIVVCAPDILFLADTDGDGKPDVRETLFTGLSTGMLERGVNCPMYYFDNWIYVGRGHGGFRVTGKYLKKPVDLPASDFRMKADGTAIEAVTGGTRTIGHAMTDWGHRLVPTTQTPAMVAAPLPWNYLARNPYLEIPNLEKDINPDLRVYPTSEAHPWRTKRHSAEGYNKIYNAKETTPNGNFTSLCSPLIYRDDALPGLKGQLFGCEPAQNLIHRENLKRSGVGMEISRVKGEEHSEFLASSDAWFHPMYISHSPDGSMCIVDFYREIIEDYSAVPRHLQQQYGVVNGLDKGRIFKLVHDKMPKAPAADMSKLSPEQLAAEISSPYYWRRETARLLIVERGDKSNVKKIEAIIKPDSDVLVMLNGLYTLDGLNALSSAALQIGLSHKEPAIRIHSLQLADKRFKTDSKLLDKAITLADDPDPNVQLQFAMSIGESDDPRVLPLLTKFACERGNVQFMPIAIMSSVTNRASAMLGGLIAKADKKELGHAGPMIDQLCATIAARHDQKELSSTFNQVLSLKDEGLRSVCLQGLYSQFVKGSKVDLTDKARETLRKLITSSDSKEAVAASNIVIMLGLETEKERSDRLAAVSKTIMNVQLPVKARRAAIRELANEDSEAAVKSLLNAFTDSTPQIRELILDTIFTRRDRLPLVVDAIEKKKIPVSSLSAMQRAAILEVPSLKKKAEELFKSARSVSDEELQKYVAALKNERNLDNGAKVFAEKCSSCHQVRGVGYSVGPNLDAEFQRAEETYVKDILAPSDSITAGYVTYVVRLNDGRTFTGLLSSESASSITLKKPLGESQTILRRDIDIDDPPKASSLSLMPENIYKDLKPSDVADVIAWIRDRQTKRVLLDNNVDLLKALDQGPGKAEFVQTGQGNNHLALRITPPQKFSAKINGWNYKIREKPVAGEYRYIRITWKSDGADGIMVELANNGKWPEINSPKFRYFAGRNSSPWMGTSVAAEVPKTWTTVTRDLWKDFGDCTITGMAPTAMSGAGLFDRIELLQAEDGK